MKRLLLLGGGHAHVHVLAALAAAPLPGVEVTLVTPLPAQIYSGMVPGFVAGHYAAADCSIPLRPLAERAGVRFVEAAVTALDATRREVVAGEHRLGYDAASLDTGGSVDRDAIAGARDHALFVRPIDRFVALWPQLRALAGERALSVGVVGGGAAGVELAMAIGHALGAAHAVTLVTGGLPVTANYPPPLQQRVERALRARGITVLREVAASIDESHVHLASGARLRCDAPVLALPAQPPPWMASAGLALCAQGFVATGPTLQSTSHAEVFAAGDVATRADIAHPRSGVYAVRAGPPLAANLRAFLAGGTLQAHRPQPRSLNLLACGDRRAIASWGHWSAEGRWAWWWKDRIDRRFIARWLTPGGGNR